MSTLSRLRYQYFPDHVLGELLTKKWMDNVIPLIALACAVATFGSMVPHFFALTTVTDLTRQVAEFGLVVLGLTIVMISGGIDLSVGAVFALSILTTLVGINVMGWHEGVALLAALGVGAFCGLVNGYLIGFLRLRAFLTTLVTMLIFRSAYELIFPRFSTAIVTNPRTSPLWEFVGYGSVINVPAAVILSALVYGACHLMISRMRLGWHFLAVGGARRSAHNAGINVKLTVCWAYVLSAVLAALAGFLFSARIGSLSSDTGMGLELQALTAAVLGGNALGGGRGSAVKALMGAFFVLILSNSLLALAVPGPVTDLILGTILIGAVFLDKRWNNNRQKLLNRVYVSPAFTRLPAPLSTEGDAPCAPNDKLNAVRSIGLGVLEGAEDVIFDRDDNLYTGNRHGDIQRWYAPDYTRHDILAHIGGSPLGMEWDRDGRLVVCVGGMGLYRIALDGQVERLTAETNRSWTSVIDDSVMRLADDLDIAPDGRIFFSEATTRFEMHDWPADALESRGNGRIICYDPRTRTTRTVLRKLTFPNGVCMAHDGESFLFAESWACRISRYYHSGPRAGQLEVLIDNLPGYPDNINRASDGTYWLALMGMRTPALDLALEMPAFRRRLAQRCPAEVWLFPNLNTGCVLKFNERGEILESLWDSSGENLPMITSMREHRGKLYLCGIFNNRMGVYDLPQADPSWTSIDDYGKAPA